MGHRELGKEATERLTDQDVEMNKQSAVVQEVIDSGDGREVAIQQPGTPVTFSEYFLWDPAEIWREWLELMKSLLKIFLLVNLSIALYVVSAKLGHWVLGDWQLLNLVEGYLIRSGYL